jgi:phosphoesterase RecJ-like protein
MSFKRAAACIRQHKCFLVTTHTSPEGDALGAELAFCQLLKMLGKRAFVVNEESPSSEYDFLPQIKLIKIRSRKIKDLKFDCFAVLDCADLARTGQVYRLNSKGATVLNIDHHTSNSKFGDINWVEPFSSSTCEMVYQFYRALKLPISDEVALLLYTGIMTDTGSFRYTNTTGLTHRIAAELLGHNLNVAQIYKNIYGNIAFEDMQLLAEVFQKMRRGFQGKVIWFEVSRFLLKKQKNFSFDFSEYLLSLGRSFKGAEVCVLFKENLGVKDEVRVNFRSEGKVDVNRIASIFGGGGHKSASGATISGKIGEVTKRVLKVIGKALRPA